MKLYDIVSSFYSMICFCIVAVVSVISGCASLASSVCPYQIVRTGYEQEAEGDTVAVYNRTSVPFVSFMLTMVTGSENSDSYTVRIRESIPPCTSLVVSIPPELYNEDDESAFPDEFSFSLSEIRFADGTVWRDPFGRYVW